MKWVEAKLKPEHYRNIIATDGKEKWESYIYPSGEWAYKRTPTYWMYVSELLNIVKNDETSVATEAQSIDSPLPPKSESELRDKFFKECVDEFGEGDKYVPSLSQYVYKSPNEVFNWFKPYLKTPIK